MIADRSPEGIFNPDCLALSALASDALDYPKTGNPVDLARIPKYKFRTKPDWSAPETIDTGKRAYYRSESAIGRLFREIKLPTLQIVKRPLRTQSQLSKQEKRLTRKHILRVFKRNRDVDEGDLVRTAVRARVKEFISVGTYDKALITEIWKLFEAYVTQFQTICFEHTISTSKTEMLTEEEALIGTIVAKSSQSKVRHDGISKLREHTTALVQSVSHQLAGKDDEGTLERAWVAYRIACMEKGSFGAKSFAWITLGEIFGAIRDIEEL